MTGVDPDKSFHMIVVANKDGYSEAVYSTILIPPVHDVAVSSMVTCKDNCLPLVTVCAGYTIHINVTIVNPGNFTENVNVTVSVNTTVVATLSLADLMPLSEVTLPFLWNTSGYTLGCYKITAYAAPVVGETRISDNTYANRTINVTKIGDINGDGVRDMRDVGSAARGFLTTPGMPFYNPNADLTDDHRIDMKDIGAIARYCFIP
jgi:hypothetical protein